jgi:hypothetical protein
MAISGTQLETWSNIGSQTQSKNTYATVKNALLAAGTGYGGKDIADPFLQGSYGNDTNVYADSDVDVVFRIDDFFFRDISRLTPADLAAYNAAHSSSVVSYGFSDFKRDVTQALRKSFGSDVTPGTKAVWIKPNGGRRNCDVIVCAQFRRYYKFTNVSMQSYAQGIGFLDSSGSLVENFPKQHSASMTTKHQATNQWFKYVVRVFKNMRNRMISDGLLADGVAPSYFIEGMLCNVPDDKFGVSLQISFVNCFNWIANANETELTCANGLHWLVRDGKATSWRPDDFKKYIAATRDFWNAGG